MPHHPHTPANTTTSRTTARLAVKAVVVVKALVLATALALATTALAGCAEAGAAPTAVRSAAPPPLYPRSTRWVWPLPGRPAVLRRFTPPQHRYGPGHRGIDLSAPPGTPVLAASAGTVTFAGPVAGRGVITLHHPNGLNTTYEPVIPQVHKGQQVPTAAPLGTLAPGHPGCPTPACLHWGLRRHHTYLNPLHLLAPPKPRLLPLPPLQTNPNPAFTPTLALPPATLTHPANPTTPTNRRAPPTKPPPSNPTPTPHARAPPTKPSHPPPARPTCHPGSHPPRSPPPAPTPAQLPHNVPATPPPGPASQRPVGSESLPRTPTRFPAQPPTQLRSTRPAPSSQVPPTSNLQPPGSGLRAPGSGLRAPGSGLRAPGSGLRAPGSGLRAPGSGLRAPGKARPAPLPLPPLAPPSPSVLCSSPPSCPSPRARSLQPGPTHPPDRNSRPTPPKPPVRDQACQPGNWSSGDSSGDPGVNRLHHTRLTPLRGQVPAPTPRRSNRNPQAGGRLAPSTTGNATSHETTTYSYNETSSALSVPTFRQRLRAPHSPSGWPRAVRERQVVR
ncbi:murein hydrolase activator EnvC family protein [Crossiella sp. CA198]|uniref:murein hydrolase activator EnvC family protein n=1 Tax=Crossiella sp. CA198 TaxID=3455607 RepID=UPI003F8D6640